MTESVFAVFVKTPGLSESKTRLGRRVGSANAQVGYERLLDVFFETWVEFERQSERAVRLVLAVAEDLDRVDAAGYWQSRCERFGLKDCERISQIREGSVLGVSPDLGTRIATVWRQLEVRGERVFILGSDSPGLSVEILEGARRHVVHGRTVIGRARDGGFYLFGARAGEFAADHWLRIPYSVSTTGNVLHTACVATGLECWETPVLSDLDEWEDLSQVEQELLRSGDGVGALLQWIRDVRQGDGI